MFLGRNNQGLRRSFQPDASQFVLTHSLVVETYGYFNINYGCIK